MVVCLPGWVLLGRVVHFTAQCAPARAHRHTRLVRAPHGCLDAGRQLLLAVDERAVNLRICCVREEESGERVWCFGMRGGVAAIGMAAAAAASVAATVAE